jgi:diguanylate cyclase (GGDEF)-like protein
MLDINHFKAINDAYGHVVGDEALSEAAQVLRSCIRSDDFLSRYAGDEFVILLDVADKAVLEATVARIHASTAQYNKATRKPFRLSFSVGYEIYGGGCEVSQDRFIAHVDSLMYGDKYSKKKPAAD